MLSRSKTTINLFCQTSMKACKVALYKDILLQVDLLEDSDYSEDE